MTDRFEAITHLFPVLDYSLGSCDRDFRLIKLVRLGLLRRTDRVCTLQQYIDPILRASKCERFSVHKVKSDGHAFTKRILLQSKIQAEEYQKKIELRLRYQRLNILFTRLEK